MKLLIIKSGLEIGGTTTSFLNLLSQIKDMEKLQTDVWIGNDRKEARNLIPDGIRVIRSKELEAGFARPSSKAGKLIEAVRLGILFDILLGRFYRRNREKLIPFTQSYTIRRAQTKPKADLTQYDAVITWEELYPCYFLAYAVQAKRKIAWIHPDYQQCGFDPNLDRKAFSMLDAVVCVSRSNQESVQKAFPEFRERIFCVPNCVDSRKIHEMSKQIPEDMPKKKGVTLITVARMQNVSKAIDRAIRIAAALKAKGRSFGWWFVGGGEDLESLRRTARQMNLNDCVFFLGARRNPYGYISNSDVLVLQSYYEGKPMAVDEALELGVPVLVSQYASAKEQVPEQVGWVAKNEEADILNAIENLVAHPGCIDEKRKGIAEYLAKREPALSAFGEMLARVSKEGALENCLGQRETS